MTWARVLVAATIVAAHLSSTHRAAAATEEADATKPTSIALSPDGGLAYVGTDDGTLLAIDLLSGDIINKLRIGRGGTYVVADPGGGRLYATALLSCGLFTIDSGTLGIIASAPAPAARPTRLLQMAGGNLVAVSQDDLHVFARSDSRLLGAPGRLAYHSRLVVMGNFVLSPYDDIEVIDARSGSRRAPITVPNQPIPLSVSLSEVVGFVLKGRRAVALDARLKVVGSLVVPAGSRALAADLEAGVLYVGIAECAGIPCEGGEVVAIDMLTGESLDSIAFDNEPYQLVLSPNAADLVVMQPFDQKLSVIRTASFSLAASFDLPGGVAPTNVEQAIAFSPDGSTVYAASEVDVFAIDLTTYAIKPVLSTARPAGSEPRPLPAGISTQRAYISHYDGSISVVDGVALTGVFGIADRLEGLTLSHDGRRLLAVSNNCAPTCDPRLWIADADTIAVEAAVDVGGSPFLPALSPDDARAYLTIEETGELVVVDVQLGEVIDRAAIGARGDLTLGSDSRLYVVSRPGLDRVAKLSVVDPSTLAVEATGSIDSGRPLRIAAIAGRLYLGPLGSGAAYDADLIGLIDPATLALTATAPVASYVHSIVPDGEGGVYLSGGPCLTNAAVDDSDLGAVSRPADASIARLAVGPETSVVYGVGSGAVLLMDAATADTLARVPIHEAATSIVVGNHPQAPPPPTRTSTATSTPTVTPTPTPSPTQTFPPVLIAASAATGSAGDDVEIDVTMSSHGHQVVGMQNDLELSADATIVGCAVNAALDKELSAFQIDGGSARAIIFGLDLDTFPQETRLYTCIVRIAADAASGVIDVSVSGALAADAGGAGLPVGTAAGSIEVRSSSAAADANVAGAPADVPAASNGGGCALGDDAGHESAVAWVMVGLLVWVVFEHVGALVGTRQP